MTTNGKRSSRVIDAINAAFYTLLAELKAFSKRSVAAVGHGLQRRYQRALKTQELPRDSVASSRAHHSISSRLARGLPEAHRFAGDRCLQERGRLHSAGKISLHPRGRAPGVRTCVAKRIAGDSPVALHSTAVYRFRRLYSSDDLLLLEISPTSMDRISHGVCRRASGRWSIGPSRRIPEIGDVFGNPSLAAALPAHDPIVSRSRIFLAMLLM